MYTSLVLNFYKNLFFMNSSITTASNCSLVVVLEYLSFVVDFCPPEIQTVAS